MTPRRGRPPLDDTAALGRPGARVVIRLSRAEYDLLRARAQETGDTLAGTVREALYEYGIDVFAAPSSICWQPPT